MFGFKSILNKVQSIIYQDPNQVLINFNEICDHEIINFPYKSEYKLNLKDQTKHFHQKETKINKTQVQPIEDKTFNQAIIKQTSPPLTTEKEEESETFNFGMSIQKEPSVNPNHPTPFIMDCYYCTDQETVLGTLTVNQYLANFDPYLVLPVHSLYRLCLDLRDLQYCQLLALPSVQVTSNDLNNVREYSEDVYLQIQVKKAEITGCVFMRVYERSVEGCLVRDVDKRERVGKVIEAMQEGRRGEGRGGESCTNIPFLGYKGIQTHYDYKQYMCNEQPVQQIVRQTACVGYQPWLLRALPALTQSLQPYLVYQLARDASRMDLNCSSLLLFIVKLLECILVILWLIRTTSMAMENVFYLRLLVVVVVVVVDSGGGGGEEEEKEKEEKEEKEKEKEKEENRVYSAQENNHYLIYCSPEGFGIGMGEGYGIYIDSTLIKGSSQPTTTFKSPCLTKTGRFTISDIKVYSYSSCYNTI